MSLKASKAVRFVKAVRESYREEGHPLGVKETEDRFGKFESTRWVKRGDPWGKILTFDDGSQVELLTPDPARGWINYSSYVERNNLCWRADCKREAEHKVEAVRKGETYLYLCSEHFRQVVPDIVPEDEQTDWLELLDDDRYEPGHCEVCEEDKDRVRDIQEPTHVISVCIECEHFGNEDLGGVKE